MTATRGTLVAIGGWAHRHFLHRLVADSTPPFGALVICEPDAAVGLDLQALFADGPSVTVIPAALGSEAQEATLTRYNFPGLESTTPPDAALTRLFPGLRALAEIPVQIMTADRLKTALEGAPRPLTCVIDAPGAEMEVLGTLEAAGLIAETELIRLRCGAEPVFSGGASEASITTWLKPRHLMLYGRDDSDPDWPELRFRVDATARALEAAKHTLTEKQAQLDALSKEIDDARQRVSEKEAALADAQAELSKQDALRSDELTALETRLTDAARAEMTETRTRAETLQRDLALALRMQALARTDLDDMREKYLESEAIRTRQEELLRQLTPRLQSAAQQLRLMVPEEPEEDVAAPAFSRTRSKGRQ